MAIVAEYRAKCGAHVVIRDDDYAHKSPEQRRREHEEGSWEILQIFAKNYYARQEECAREYLAWKGKRELPVTGMGGE